MAIEYDHLSFGEKKYYDRIYQGILNNAGSVTLIGLFKMEILQKIIIALKYDHLELFYVDFRRINCAVTPMGMVYYIHYLVRENVRDNMKHNLENWITASLMQMQLAGNETEASIYRKVHNFLMRNIEYDYDALQDPSAFPESFTVQGVFERNKAVCEGISKTFKLLCERAGAKNVYVIEGTSSREGFGTSIPHAWNIVKCGSNYSHIDVTWDLGSSKVCRHNRYDYFMIPDEWIKEDHIYTNKFLCQTDDQSYFSQQNCLLVGFRSLKEFLREKLQNKSSFLYFKIVGKNGIPDDIDNRIQNLVQSMVQQYCGNIYSLEMTPNRAQHIFFYKINY